MDFRERRFVIIVLLLIGLLGGAVVGFAQSSAPTVPRMLHFAGTIKSADNTPRTGVVGVMFSLYKDQQGDAALWTELQNVTLDANGQYAVLLGSQHSDGVPAELFTTNEARWLGIQVDAEPEQPRVLLVSVPYALKAGDAETLGGRRVTDFLLSPTATTNPDGTTTGTTATTSINVVPNS